MLDAGPDPATGRRRQVWRGGFATKREAQRALREALSRVDQGTFVAQPRVTVGNYLDLGKALADAERWGMLAANPVRRVRPPRWSSPEMRVWSAEQTLAFLDASAARRLHAAFVLLATTGMRRGEDAPDAVSRAFAALVRQTGLPRIRLHELRRGWARLALGAGVHPKVVSERLGHSTVGITLDTYSHVVQGLDTEAAATVAKKLFRRRDEAEPRSR